MKHINHDLLNKVLSKMLSITISCANHETTQLHGGTLGDVHLVTGIATTASNQEIPYKVVWKIQKKWNRPGDPNSWRREYDLYTSDFDKVFTESFSMPECYYAEMMDEEIHIWMEYIDGISGNNLSIDMLEQAAYHLGCFQGKYSSKFNELKNITYLNDIGFLEREFSQWHNQSFTYDDLIAEYCPIPSFLKEMLKDGDIQLIDGKSFEYSFLRSKGCHLPEHIKEMMIDIDEHFNEMFDKIKMLPIVLCHRDYWHENIFYQNNNVSIIDWDTSGWGYFGEDIASLIVDEMAVEQFEENYNRLMPAYIKGLSDYMDVSSIDNTCILDIILIKFGYRMLQDYMYTESKDEYIWGIHALEKIYEMRNINV